MSENNLHSLILACDFRVDDVERMWGWLKKHRDGLASIGAHHVVLYTSIWEPRRVLVTIGIRRAGSIREVLRSPAIFEWFDISGVDDIPPIFGGEVVEKIDLYPPSPEDHVGRVVVGVMSSVHDVGALMVKVHDGLDRFKRGGVRKIWVYRALDDGHEVLILQEIEDEVAARQWLDHPDAAAEWMCQAGFGPYPTQFVGRFAHIMSIDERSG
ncbi:fatty-acid--CoA ligase [Mycolicibacterium pulveris]|uniref:Fatty-acid--CoA ligase n=1 Tax=Mycolicibacterium pulveris TaxID=36813 RepID=A0A7I7UQB2_MYCPV|nr:fatty-acid--CoA ligase [Mycolicibacterium pulveris]MCV6983676.1 fatty-acid--CoA ligase [Mycolicibacterium pulveris]BBY83557.1 fatty-acid--CoA ligase [Mycolicibacterium pulveris]